MKQGDGLNKLFFMSEQEVADFVPVNIEILKARRLKGQVTPYMVSDAGTIYYRREDVMKDIVKFMP